MSYIGHASIPRRSLPSRFNHITQKIRFARQRTLYLSVHDDAQPAEIFLRLKDWDCSSELIGLYDVVAHRMSLAAQCGGPCLSRSAISSLGPNLLHAAGIRARSCIRQLNQPTIPGF